MRSSILIFLFAAALGSCAELSSKQAILYTTNQALTRADCLNAIIAIESLYNSSSSDNEVRKLRASAHGCKAGINFFPLVGDLAVGTFTGTGLWRTITRLFPSTGTDGKFEASFFATDALLSWLNPGTVVYSPYRIADDPYNIGSTQTAHRTSSSNLYLALVSMASIGTLHNKYGAPNASYAPTQSLPWTTLAAMDETGCGYASALLNLMDSLTVVGSQYTQLSGVSSAVTAASAGFDAACAAGCTAHCPSLSCSGCPVSLRHRKACDRTTATTEKVEACAAAGLVGLMNSALGWQ
jgi:hypothetical protein